MALPEVLVDSSFLYALFRKSDPDHQAVSHVFLPVSANFIIPQSVLTEAAWLFNRAGQKTAGSWTSFHEWRWGESLPPPVDKQRGVTYTDRGSANPL